MIRKAIVISDNDVEYLFAYDNEIMITYIDELGLLNSILHIDEIDILILDSRLFKRNIDLYHAYEKVRLIHKETSIYLLIDTKRTSLIWLTDYLIHTGFTNFIDVDNTSENLDIENQDLSVYMIPYQTVTGGVLKKRKIKKNNKKIYTIYKEKFFTRKVDILKLKKIARKMLFIILLLIFLIMGLKYVIELILANYEILM